MITLLTGGSGLLGRQLRKLLNVDSPTHEELDITRPVTWERKYDLVIHAAAYTDTQHAENRDRRICMDTNSVGTMHMAEKYWDVPFVYISSEYAKDPVNFYGLTKYMGECVVKNVCRSYLIIRTLFKPRPFPWEQAFVDQWTQGDYVDVIAPLIVKQILEWDKKTSDTVYVGTERKTMYDLAVRTRPDVGKLSVNDIQGVAVPKDYL